MTTDDTYNGWKNRETWAINLWLANDHGLYLETLDVARGAVDGYAARCTEYDIPQHEPGAASAVGAAIVEWFENELPDVMGKEQYVNMRNDIGSLWRVDERELGEGWLADIRDEEEVS